MHLLSNTDEEFYVDIIKMTKMNDHNKIEIQESLNSQEDEVVPEHYPK